MSEGYFRRQNKNKQCDICKHVKPLSRFKGPLAFDCIPCTKGQKDDLWWYDPEQIDHIKRLLNNGLTFEQIAKRLKIKKSRIKRMREKGLI